MPRHVDLLHQIWEVARPTSTHLLHWWSLYLLNADKSQKGDSMQVKPKDTAHPLTRLARSGPAVIGRRLASCLADIQGYARGVCHIPPTSEDQRHLGPWHAVKHLSQPHQYHYRDIKPLPLGAKNMQFQRGRSATRGDVR